MGIYRPVSADSLYDDRSLWPSITYLRVSVTDRCDFRCVYCMAEDMTFLPKAELLTLEEMDRLCSAFVRLGVRKLRLTGGEPLVRKNVMCLIRNLSRHLKSGALDELTLTTNGSQLGKYAGELADCGVKRVNVSVDTLEPDEVHGDHPLGQARPGDGRHRRGEGRRPPGQDQHRRAQGRERRRVRHLIEWCGREGHDLTFIEVMPMGDIGDGARLDQYLPISVVRANLAQIDAGRHRLPHRRPGALCAGARDRRPRRLHHAADA